MAKKGIKLKKMLGEVTLEDYKEARNILDKEGWDKKYDAEPDNEFWVQDEHGERGEYPVKMVMRKLLELKKTGYDDDKMQFNSKVAKKIIENIPGRTEYGIDFSEKGTGGSKPESEKPALNQILYGPPGTGKTYNTIIKAMEIIQKDCIKYDKNNNVTNYQDVKIEFDKYKGPNKENYKEWYKNNKNINDKTLSDYFSNYTKYEEEGLNLFDVTSEEELKKFREKLEKSERFKTQERHEWINALTNSYLEFYKKYILQIEFITFHQSYSYEEFVEGIRPVIKNKEKNDIQFEYHDGIFKNMCRNARNNPDKKFVLIIDEINRGNISKIFGELITLIEPDKRENVTGDKTREYHTIEVTLPYSNEPFTVPNNLYIIGTMNTADKSLTLLDAALRRRFEFIPMYPQYENIANMHYGDFLKKLNDNILGKKNYNADYLIGHSYFIGKEEKNLKDILNKNVIPLLMEYFNGKVDEVKGILDSCGYVLAYDSDYKVKDKDNKYFFLKVDTVKPNSSNKPKKSGNES